MKSAQVYPYFNRPSRPVTNPPGAGVAEWDYTFSHSMLRDLAHESRAVAPRLDGMKTAAQPVPRGDMRLQHRDTTSNAYWGSDHHNWIQVPWNAPFKGYDYNDPSLPDHISKTKYLH